VAKRPNDKGLRGGPHQRSAGMSQSPGRPLNALLDGQKYPDGTFVEAWQPVRSADPAEFVTQLTWAMGEPLPDHREAAGGNVDRRPVVRGQ
jgi:hypothetical protein